MCMHNDTVRVVRTAWLLLGIQSVVDLIANPKMLVNIRVVCDEYTIRVHYNSGIKLINQIGELSGYSTIWYEPTGIANILLMSRVTRKYLVVFDFKGRDFFRMMLSDHEIRFQLSPNGLYYSDAVDQENNMLLLNMVVENR